MILKRLQQLHELFDFFKESENEKFFKVKNPYFKGNIEVENWFLPTEFFGEESRDYPKEIELMNDIFAKFGYSEINEDEITDIRNGLGWNVMTFKFLMKDRRGWLTELPITFTLIKNAEGTFDYIYCNHPTMKKIINIWKESKPFDTNNASEEEGEYFAELLRLTGVVYEAMFNKAQEEDFDENRALDEFLRLLNSDNYLSEEAIVELKSDWNDLKTNPMRFAEKLIEEREWIEEDLEYIEQREFGDLAFSLLKFYFEPFSQDWKFEHDSLSEYISEAIGRDFFISYEECEFDAGIVREKLENTSDFSLVHLTSGNDDVNLLVIKKADAEQIYRLAEKLGIWLG